MNYSLEYGTNTVNLGDSTGMLAGLMGFIAAYSIVILAIGVLSIIEEWIIFKKCGKKGWEILIPIYNVWTLFSISGLPGWLCLVPVANGIGLIVAQFKLAKRFGKGFGFGLGMLFFPQIFMGILAFSKATVVDADAAENPESITNTDIPQSVEIPSEQANVVPDLMAASPLEVNQVPNVVPVNEELKETSLNMEETVNEPIITSVSETPVADVPVMDNAPVNLFEEPVVEMPQPVANSGSIVNEPVVQAQEPETLVMDNAPVNLFEEPLVEMPQPVANSGSIVNEPVVQAQEPETLVMDNAPVNLFEESVVEMPKAASVTEELTLDETVELPKMANEIINNDITAVKKCPICGLDNPYTNKVCSSCGTNLE